MNEPRTNPTIRDVARAAGVSAPTVSRALRGNAVISAETRARILEAVRALGYRLPSAPPTEAASPRLTLGIYHTRGFLGPGYSMAILGGILRRAHEIHHSVLILEVELDTEQPHRSIRLNLDGRCDGLLYHYEGDDTAYKEALRERGMPLVVIGDPTAPDPIVDLDHDDAIRQGLEHLTGFGHRRIVFLSGSQAFAHATVARRESFHRRYGEAGEVAEQPVWVDGDDFAFAWVADWVARPAAERPTAALCWNDGMAMAILQAAERRGVSVPTELSLMGIDDDPALPEVATRLTTIAQPYDALGRAAVDLLLALIAGREDVERRVFLPGRLIVRNTTAPPQEFSSSP